MSYWDGSRWATEVQPATKSSRHGRRLLGAAAEAGLISLLLVGLIAGTTFAAKGGRGTTSGGTSYSVSVSPAGPYAFGQAVYATTNAPIYAGGAGPYLWLRCYQNGSVVLATDHAGFEGGWYYNDPFMLGPTQTWAGGDADCTLTVVHRRNSRVITDAATSFHVGG
jgi:hypothetical protein